MTFQALLVSKDESSSHVLTGILREFEIQTRLCGYSEALCLLTEQRFDAVLADFADPHSAALILQAVSQSLQEGQTVTVALINDDTKVRSAFGAGANFVLYQPIAEEAARAALRAATALLQRERRRSFRVPVQVPLQLFINRGTEIEAFLLDLSEDGMDMVAAQPLCPSALVQARFILPGESKEVEVQAEVAWANPNGQCGIRFVDPPESTRAYLRSWFASHAQVEPPADPEPVSQCKLTDLSPGGCYVQTMSPFPERSGIVLCLQADAVEVQAEGMVRVMHPGSGMGIEFVLRTGEQRQHVSDFIDFLTSRPGLQPQLLITPRALITDTRAWEDGEGGSEELPDPLLDLLRNHEALSLDEFMEALRGQRSTSAAAGS